MAQSESKGFETSDHTTETVHVNVVGRTLLAGGARAANMLPKHQAAEEQLQCQEEGVKEKQLDQERVEEEERRRQEAEEQQCLEREHSKEQLCLEREHSVEVQAGEEQRWRAEAELAEREGAERVAAEEAARRAVSERNHTAEELVRKMAQEKVDVFLKAKGFKNMSMPRTSCFSATYPLHGAVQENNAGLVYALLLSGADKNVKNSAGKTPLEAAEKLETRAPMQSLQPWLEEQTTSQLEGWRGVDSQ
eukprot:CAMPEP_0183388014 /NCGR_PEP_ID=MMETSP0370-20130417/3757_1 /TAXON_ID=268820 /ORGANISM="Peridinium aciculiferum, Strain PAER-2" /LENGTH=248 /DNA_ID=CAMNT_0025566831 /DNA_START=67 /DNA_END=814 /DNA_ORIENTATION=-